MANAAMASRSLSTGVLDRVEKHLHDAGRSPEQMTAESLRRAYPNVEAAAGWRVDLDSSRKVDVLLTADYPYDQAQIGVVPLGEDAPHEHIVTDNTWCLLKATEGHELADDERVLEALLERAHGLLANPDEDKVARNAEEIIDYWKGSRNRRIVSLCTPEAEPREVYYSDDLSRFTVVGDSQDDVSKWVRHAGGPRNPTVKKSALLVSGLDFPMYVPSGRALYTWFEEHYSDQLALVESVAAGDPLTVPIVVAIKDAVGGTALLGCRVRRQKKNKVGIPRLPGTPGFRSKKASGHIAAPYFFSSEASVEKVYVERADVVWLVNRGGEGSSETVRSAKVTLIGCGSLGASLAMLLVKGGVSHLTLIDPDTLRWGNIARHELGGDYVGRSKANALAEMLTRNFPHVEITAHPTSWQDAFASEPEAFTETNLIISSTGEPASEIQLSDAALKSDNFAPVLYTWFEPYVAAARALLLLNNGCLRCGCDEFGVFKSPVTDWDGQTHQFEPGCSSSWQPYSEIHAAPAKSYIAGLVLNILDQKPGESVLWTFVGFESIRQQHGGKIRAQWIASHGEPPSQGALYRESWVAGCDGCKKVA